MTVSGSGPAPNAVPRSYHDRDAERLVAWLREAADEIEKAHALLDEFGVPRVRAESGNVMTLAARIYTLGGAA